MINRQSRCGERSSFCLLLSLLRFDVARVIDRVSIDQLLLVMADGDGELLE